MAEQTRRVNVTVSLLKGSASLSEVLARLMAVYGLSRRQAYRYVQQAQQAPGPLPIPEEKSVLTVKLSGKLIAQVRQQARQERCSISLWVDQALRRALIQHPKHG